MEIEAGKCYLALMKHFKDKDLYAFLDMEDGLREIDLPAQNKVKHESYDLNKLNVRNSVTGEMEPLISVIEKLK